MYLILLLFKKLLKLYFLINNHNILPCFNFNSKSPLFTKKEIKFGWNLFSVFHTFITCGKTWNTILNEHKEWHLFVYILFLFDFKKKVCFLISMFVCFALVPKLIPRTDNTNLGYTFFFGQYVCSLGIKPTTFCAANAMLYHWATPHQLFNCNLMKLRESFLYAKKTKITLFKNYGWTTDVAWTILLMSLLPLWALNVVVPLRSIDFLDFIKYLNLCSWDERRSYRFGSTWGWVKRISPCFRRAFNSFFSSRARYFTTFTLYDFTDFYVERATARHYNKLSFMFS